MLDVSRSPSEMVSEPPAHAEVFALFQGVLEQSFLIFSSQSGDV